MEERADIRDDFISKLLLLHCLISGLRFGMASAHGHAVLHMRFRFYLFGIPKLASQNYNLQIY